MPYVPGEVGGVGGALELGAKRSKYFLVLNSRRHQYGASPLPRP